MFCKHEWEVVADKVTEAPIEVALKSLDLAQGEVNIPHKMCRTDRKSITILTCKKCGKVDKTIVALD